jgi:hypothetical protein
MQVTIPDALYMTTFISATLAIVFAGIHAGNLYRTSQKPSTELIISTVGLTLTGLLALPYMWTRAGLGAIKASMYLVGFGVVLIVLIMAATR